LTNYAVQSIDTEGQN